MGMNSQSAGRSSAGWVLLRRVAPLCAIFALLLPGGGCSGGSDTAALRKQVNPPAHAEPVPVTQPVDLEAARREVAELECPKGVDADLWETITTEFLHQLESTGKSTASVPKTLHSQANMELGEEFADWGYCSQGDYDQNSEVNASDLTPLAIHFHKSVAPSQFPHDSIEAVVDGDANGEINLADIQPIAINFHNSVTEYLLFGSESEDDYPATTDGPNGPGAVLLNDPDFSTATGDPKAARIQFSSPLTVEHEGLYIWARPTDGSETGTPSTLAGPYLAPRREISGYVYLAGPGLDPLPGATLELSGDATLSTTTDDSGRYVFQVPDGAYTVTPTGDPYGYTPVNRFMPVDGEDVELDEFRQAPVDIVHTWNIDIADGVTGRDLAFDAEGNILIAVEFSNSASPLNIGLLKYDLSGNLLSDHVYNIEAVSNLVQGPEIRISADGSIYLAGSFWPEEDRDAIFLVHLDENGNLIWSRTYASFNSDRFGSFHFDPTGKIFLLGSLWGGGQDHLMLFRLSVDGTLLNSLVYYYDGTTFQDGGSPSAFNVTPSGDFTISGDFGDSRGDYRGFHVMRCASDGAIRWQKYIELPTWGYSINGQTIDQAGNVYVAGRFNVEQFGKYTTLLAKFGATGDLHWQRKFVGAFSLHMKELTVDRHDNLYISGDDQDDLGNEADDIWLYSLRQDGSVRYGRKWVTPTDVNEAGIDCVMVNRHDVTVLTGTSFNRQAQWVEDSLEVLESQFTPEDLTFVREPGLDFWQDKSVSQTGQTGVVDVDSNNRQVLLMLYRP